MCTSSSRNVQFLRTEVGLQITAEGLFPVEEKIEAVRRAPVPATLVS